MLCLLVAGLDTLAAPTGPRASAAAPPPIPVLPPVDPGPDGSVPITRIPSPATQTITPLGPVDPGPNEGVTINRAPVVLDPPVEPSPLTLPFVPAQVLIDGTEADALGTLGGAQPSFLGAGGTPDLDPSKLQPQVASAGSLPTERPSLIEINASIAGIDIFARVSADLTTLLTALPGGLPRLTYRICSESTSRPVACTAPMPLGAPARIDVTGDGSFDVLAGLRPTASTDVVVRAANEVLALEAELATLQSRVSAIVTLLRNPLNLLRNPGLLLDALRLRQLVTELQGELSMKVEALVSISNSGLGLIVQRLASSETTGSNLPAHVWAVYDVPTPKRLSLGFDGFRRGTTLPDSTSGVFSFDNVAAAAGTFDVGGSLTQRGAGSALAVTLGLASIAQDQAGSPFDPTVTSARFAPVPAAFGAHAVVDLAEEQAAIDAQGDGTPSLDAIVVSRRGGGVPFGRFTQLIVDGLPSSLSAALNRGDGATGVEYRAAARVGDLSFVDFKYAGITLQQAVTAAADDLPTAIDAVVSAPSDVSVDYTASSRATGLDIGVFDRPAANLIATASLRDLPSELSLTVDPSAHRLRLDGNERLGSCDALVSRRLGSFAPLEGEHATLITAGAGLGASARLTGVRSVDAGFGPQPGLSGEFEQGTEPLVAAGDIDGIYKTRIEVSNVPATMSVDLDPAARTLSSIASSVVEALNAAFIKTDTGPTVFANIADVPTSLDASWRAGLRSEIDTAASSAVPRIELFASPQPIETLQPLVHQYLSIAARDVPPQTALVVDLPERHLDGETSRTLGSLDAVSRFDVGSDPTFAMLDLISVPARFDGDFPDGSLRLRGITGPVGSAVVAVSNHADTDAPTGQHLAVRFRETTGEFDASMFARNVTHLEYSTPQRSAQTTRLDADTVGEPLFIAADVVFAAGGVDDTRLATFSRIDGLPATLTSQLAAGELMYTANSSVSILTEVRFGKVAALSGLGAPIFANGVAMSAKGCAPGPGCATDTSSFCTSFPACLGVVATMQLPGLPSSMSVDLVDRRIEMSRLNAPASVPLPMYLRLLGLVPSVPELEVLSVLGGLPSPLDFTIGPLALDANGALRVAGAASAAVGSLDVVIEAHDTPTLGTLRGQANAAPVPSSMDITGQFGTMTRIAAENSEPVDTLTAKITGVSSGFLDATMSNTPSDVELVADLNTRHVESTASGTVGAIDVLTRVPFGGRTWGMFAELAGVPAGWDADFGDGTLRFRGLSGTLGSAQFAVTNHSAASVPTGQHLASHYRQLTGDLDAALRVTNLSLVELGRTSTTTSLRFDSGGELVTIDADSRLSANGFDDTISAVVARLDTPNTLQITSADGSMTFLPGTPVALTVETRIGKLAALTGLSAPLFTDGVGVRARGCSPGPGCATDTSVLCQLFGRCGGIVSIINLPGLPTEVVTDLEADQVTITGYDPPPGSELKVFMQLDDLKATVPHAAGLATLGGLPFSLDLTVGPFSFVDGDVTKLEVGYSGTSSLGALQADVEADTTTIFGDLRGRTILQPVPASTLVNTEFGSVSTIDVDMNAPIDILSTQVTGLLQGNPASGIAAVTNVPARIDLTMEGFAEEALGVPTITYAGRDAGGNGSSTLDGSLQVEADLIEAFSTGGVSIPVAGDAWARVTNLGADTTVQTNPDTSVNFSSDPATGELALGGVLETSVANIPVNLQVFDQAGFTGTLVGSVGAPTVHVGDLELSMSGLRSMRLSPSEVTYLTIGVEGDYDLLSVDVADVFIDPDVELTLEVDGPLFLDFPIGPVVIDDPYTSARLHLSDQVLRESGCVTAEVFGVGQGHVRIFTKPGQIDSEVNRIDVFGVNGPQAINYLDPVPTPLGTDPDLVSMANDWITVYVTDPFGDSDAAYEPDLGSC